MADVRLTATNPEDSSVVPVACDAAGRLLLEEPQVIEGPPGPRGEQGPPGQNGQDGQDGDPFSGNFAGDVTFGGSASIAGDIKYGGFGYVAEGDLGLLYSGSTNGTYGVIIGTEPGSTSSIERTISFSLGSAGASEVASIHADGSAEFAGDVEAAALVVTDSTKGLTAYADNSNPTNKSLAIYNVNTADYPAYIHAEGSASFAGNKAGFTAEGYLWCTTRRGDTVVLDFTSNGTGQWVEYTPTTRKEELRDKLDAIRGHTGEIPTDTP